MNERGARASAGSFVWVRVRVEAGRCPRIPVPSDSTQHSLRESHFCISMYVNVLYKRISRKETQT
eukprot:scaffold39517_cov150-Skeletonema_dohrnii-CCMP3373.AAC.3